MNLFSYIKQQLPILDVVREYATLKKAGTYYKGCCPFHHERTASFTVTPDKEIFYCFGCHVGGDVISFISKIENTSQLEAARHLVERHSISIPQEIAWDKAADSYEVKKSYHKTCDVFMRWCASQLQKSDTARQYVLDRSITQESIQAFNIGYCSTDLKSLLTYAQKDAILAQSFLDAHILKEGRMGLYIAFDERIIFPIKDHLGATVGFGGRVFKNGDERAKYYNSHDHTYFNKGNILFGLDRAKKVIAQKEEAFLVEGYTDLIMMHQYGYTNTVATLGTSCSLDHLKHLARYAQRLYIMYDGDAAGHNAIMRLAELCWEVSLDLYVVILPADDDPASYLLKESTLDKPLEEAHDIFSFVVHHLADGFTQKSLQGKLGVTQRILSIIQNIKDPLKRDLLLQQASDAFNISYETMAQSMHQQKKPKPAIRPVEESSEQLLLKTSSMEKKLFSVILNSSGALSETDCELLDLLLEGPLKNIFAAWNTTQTEDGTDISAFLEQLTEDEKTFVSYCLTAEPEEDIEKILPVHLTHLYKKQWKKKVLNVKLMIVEAEKRGERDQIAQLLTDLNALKHKMLGRGIS